VVHVVVGRDDNGGSSSGSSARHHVKMVLGYLEGSKAFKTKPEGKMGARILRVCGSVVDVVLYEGSVLYTPTLESSYGCKVVRGDVASLYARSSLTDNTKQNKALAALLYRAFEAGLY